MSGRRGGRGGQMTRGANSGPAIMLMPPRIRATFAPNPPLKSIPPIRMRRKNEWTGMMSYMDKFEKTPAPPRAVQPTPKALKDARNKKREEANKKKLEPLIEEFRNHQRDCSGEYKGMNCYNTLFVGRLAYEVTERKLLREMESYGPVKDLRLVTDRDGKSKGYAFVEYENEDDMKRAYRAADGQRIEGREIVADVERGHTVPTWLPRRLGGGLGGTRLGGKHQNYTAPGRFDPSRPEASRPPPPMGGGPPPPHGMGRGQPPPPMGYGGGYDRRGPPPPGDYGGYGGRDWDRGRKRHSERSSSPGRYAPRPRY